MNIKIIDDKKYIEYNRVLKVMMSLTFIFVVVMILLLLLIFKRSSVIMQDPLIYSAKIYNITQCECHNENFDFNFNQSDVWKLDDIRGDIRWDNPS